MLLLFIGISAVKEVIVLTTASMVATRTLSARSSVTYHNVNTVTMTQRWHIPQCGVSGTYMFDEIFYDR